MKHTRRNALPRARQQCAEQGIRLTAKREQLLQLLLAADTPLSAYELAAQYQAQTHETIPPMSVYRMLEALCAAGCAHRLATTSRFVACAHIACDHAHETPQFLICDRCSNVEEIGMTTGLLEALLRSLTDTGFQPASPHLEWHGLCARCRRQAA